DLERVGRWPIANTGPSSFPEAAGRLRVLRSCVTCLCPATSVEMERITVRAVHRTGGGGDLARARGGDPAALPRRALADRHTRPATSCSPRHGAARADAGRYPRGSAVRASID